MLNPGEVQNLHPSLGRPLFPIEHLEFLSLQSRRNSPLISAEQLFKINQQQELFAKHSRSESHCVKEGSAPFEGQ